MKDSGWDGSSTSAPVRCSSAPRASRTTPRPRRAHYAAAKAGALGLTRSLACTGGVQPLRQAARYPWVLAAPSSAVALGRHRRAGRLRFSSPGRGRTSLPGASIPCRGVTLSDAGVKENAREPRRYGRQADLLLDFVHGDRTSRSARGLHSRLVCDAADDGVFASGPPGPGHGTCRWGCCAQVA